MTEKIRDRVLTRLAQKGRHVHRDQAKAPCPPDQIGQPVVSGRIQQAGQTQKGSHTHPVGGNGDSVVGRRNGTAGNVVLLGVRGVTQRADHGEDQNGTQQEKRGDPAARQPGSLQRQHHCNDASTGKHVRGKSTVQATHLGASRPATAARRKL